MSAYATLRVTRAKAVQMLMAKFIAGHTDDDLEQFMNNELESRLYNAIIVSDDSENDDDVI